MKKLISILKKSTQNFKEIAQNQNQIVLKIGTKIQNGTVNELPVFIHTQQNYSTTAFQFVYDFLEKSETPIRLLKLNTFHNSVIEPIELLKATKSISMQLKQNKILFEITS